MVYIYFRSKHRQSEQFDLYDGADIVSHPRFDSNRRTVLYIHGFADNQSAPFVVDAYLERNEHNVIVLDWLPLARGDYFANGIQNIKKVSGYIIYSTQSNLHVRSASKKKHIN